MDEPPAPAMPTTTFPGTEAKLKVMAARMARRENLYHPDDPVWERDDADRVVILGCRLRNGVASRMNEPLAEQRHDGTHVVAPATPRPPTANPAAGAVPEGFFLPAECVVVVGRLPGRGRRKKAGGGAAFSQLWLFPPDATQAG